jgi:primosomal protein N' (replication factor Y)
MNTLVRVALKIAHNNGVLTYAVKKSSPEENLWGLLVNVSVKNRMLKGVIIGEDNENTPDFAIKYIENIIDQRPIITPEQWSLINFCSSYYFNDLGPCVHLAVPRNNKRRKNNNLYKPFMPDQAKALALNDAQRKAVDSICAQKSGAFLLEGITGSGKTHVYLEAARKTLIEGRTVLFLVPEISLTPQLISRVEDALETKAALMHSNITPAKKRDALLALLEKKSQVLIGARSAIFAPLPNLGLIVVDEEHDSSFKQDESPRYHARDLALWRAKQEGARVILGSATPSLESSFNARNGRLVHLFLQERFHNNRMLPRVELIDLSERAHDVLFRTQDQSKSAGSKMCIISRPLQQAMEQTLNNKQQVLLFLNQRGYARFGICYECGTLAQCPSCSVALTYYQKHQRLSCHQCLHSEAAKNICSQCHQESLRFVGLGTERLEEEIKILFPHHATIRLDRDIIRSQERLLNTLNAMHEQKADILIGTQMIAKGHDFLHVGLVGIVCADVALSMPDFRAAEKTFQLLTQVAGRAGRGGHEGKALIQTFNTKHPSIYFAQQHNSSAFTEQELLTRKRFSNPPFSKAALIRIEHREEAVAEHLIAMLYKNLSTHKELHILGPASSPIERINNRFRFQCLLQSPRRQELHNALKNININIIKQIKQKRARFIIDVDPYNMS